jgi:NADPH-dependent glutamate synthase beta subunit-like oxidoreductase
MVKPAETQPQVAIIGSGPAGLSCGFFLALMGRRSVIYEAQPVPGGMLALGIPEYRLPKDVLEKEIEFILSHGIELKTSTRIEEAGELIKKGYKAVFVATGAQMGKSIDIEGIRLKGVVDSLEFLRDRALGKGMDCRGKRIVILGGGNQAVDAARSAIRLDAEKVTILYRRTREEMPAYKEEIEEAINEGVELVTLAVPKRIVSSNGLAKGIEFMKAELGKAEADGRRRPIPVEGSETVVECDIIMPAIGQVVSTETVRYTGGPELTNWGTIKTDPVTLKTSDDRIFSGGDCVRGADTVIQAIADGQIAAINIDRMLGGNGALPQDTGFSITKPDEEKLAESIPRAQEKFITLDKRTRGFAEVVLGLDRQQALGEAGRCLRCDLEHSG